MTDEELMQAYIKGDIAAFHELYQRHKGRILGYLNSQLQNPHEAEEVFQEVFTKLHRYRFKYKEEIPFLAWLFTIVKNATIDHTRKRATQNRHIQLDVEQINNTPDEKITHHTIGETISELSSLSAKQRQLLELRFNEGLSFAEIAEQMDISQPNTRQIISRAIRQLRDLISDKER